MDWAKAIKVGGISAIVAYLLNNVIEHLFNKDIVDLVGADRIFYLLILLISALLLILLVSIIFKPKEVNSNPSTSTQGGKSDGPKVTYKDNSTHNGDNNF